MTNITTDLRWKDYFLRKGNGFEQFWEQYLKNKKNILFVLGVGFDPRMCLGIKKIIEKNTLSTINCCAIDFKETKNSPSSAHSKDKKNNFEELYKICQGKASIDVIDLVLSDNSNKINLHVAAKLFSKIDDFKGYTDIIIDISSMPLSLYFPLIAKILNILDKYDGKENIPNLHVVVSENTNVDKCIVQQELEDEAILVYPFMANLDTEDPEKIPLIWIPVVGENQTNQLEKINTLLKPDEVSPILPLVSTNPRRGDEIFLNYHKLFSRFRIDPKNIVSGTEQNPFQVYREIILSVLRYRNSLNSLGRCKIAVSALSSKLFSMAVFLSAYEGKTKKMDIGVAQVFSKGFIMKENCIENDLEKETELFTMWISGDCYNE